MTPDPTIHLTGIAPDRYGWKITLGVVPMASSTRRDMTEAEAMQRARTVLAKIRADQGEKK